MSYNVSSQVKGDSLVEVEDVDLQIQCLTITYELVRLFVCLLEFFLSFYACLTYENKRKHTHTHTHKHNCRGLNLAVEKNSFFFQHTEPYIVIGCTLNSYANAKFRRLLPVVGLHSIVSLFVQLCIDLETQQTLIQYHTHTRFSYFTLVQVWLQDNNLIRQRITMV